MNLRPRLWAGLAASLLLTLRGPVRAETTCPSAAGHSLDLFYEGVSRNIAALSHWLDSFFGNYPVEEEALENRVRVAPSVEFREGDSPEFKLRVGARLWLPQLNRRIRLVLAMFEDEEPAKVGEPRQFPPNEDGRQAALRYLVGEIKRNRLDADVGLRFYPEPDPYVRLRWRYQLIDTPVTAGRLIEYVFWSPRRGWGETTRLEVDRKLAPNTLGRSVSAATWSETTRGVDWSQTLALWHGRTKRRAFGLEWLTEGYTEPGVDAERSRMTLYHRQRVIRDWLFVQVGPFLEWPRDRDFDLTPGMVLQVETVWGEHPPYEF